MVTDRLIWILKVVALLTVTTSFSFLLSNSKALQCIGWDECFSCSIVSNYANLITMNENTAHILPCHSAGFMTRSSQDKTVVILRSDGRNWLHRRQYVPVTSVAENPISSIRAARLQLPHRKERTAGKSLIQWVGYPNYWLQQADIDGWYSICVKEPYNEQIRSLYYSPKCEQPRGLVVRAPDY
jgi:hypothetical protein